MSPASLSDGIGEPITAASGPSRNSCPAGLVSTPEMPPAAGLDPFDAWKVLVTGTSSGSGESLARRSRVGDMEGGGRGEGPWMNANAPAYSGAAPQQRRI